jgi:hypothetical protein
MSLHNLNTPNKQWLMYLNTLSSISGDDLTIKPDTRRNLVLEVSGNNNIFIKKGDISYNLTNYITGDASFSNVDVSVNLNPLRTNNSRLGLPGKLWGNAYIRDISITNISVSGNMTISGISNVIQIIPRLANDISSSLGSTTNIWQRAFIRDLSNISTINGTNWPITGPAGPTGPAGALGVSVNATLTDISNIRLTTKSRIYQNISGSFNDPTWHAVNGYYGLAKDAYPCLNPLSSGVLAVRTWRVISSPLGSNFDFYRNCWSPELRIFVFIYGSSIAISSNGTSWSLIANNLPNTANTYWTNICWSPQLKIFLACAFNHDTTKVSLMRSSDGVIWSDSTFTHSPASQATAHAWNDVCWSPELGIFVVVGRSRTGHPSNLQAAYIASSSDGINWQPLYLGYTMELRAVCWSPELRIFVAVGNGVILRSTNGITWINDNRYQTYPSYYGIICWSSQLGIFVVGERGSIVQSGIHTSSDGITWTNRIIPTSASYNDPICIVWSPQLGIFFVTCNNNFQLISKDGINWEAIAISSMVGSPVNWFSWSPELGIFCGGSGYNVLISSLKGRPPTSYNLFDSSFNSIDETGKWNFQNMNVKAMTAGGAPVSSDDRLKHNEIVITNGLEIIEQLTPKFYQKTQVLLDASYNGDLSGYAWNYEAGLIAQEVLQISDLSFVVGGGDYYEQKYIYKRQTQDLSANYYELSNNYYQQRANNYEISYNLIAQAYNINYNSVFVYGLAAIKELHTKVKAQDTSILDEQLNDLITRIEALESTKQDVSNNIL